VNILVISSNLIGDTIMSTGIIDHFIKLYPDSKITIAAGPTSAPVFKNFPNIEKLLIVKKTKFSMHWIKIWQKCFLIKWDLIIDFRSSLISFFLINKKRYIFKHKNIQKNQVRQLSEFFKISEVPHPIIYNSYLENEVSEKKLISNYTYVVIAPGGNWIPKIWPIEKYNNLMIRISSLNKKIKFVLIGSKKDRVLYKQKLIQDIATDDIIDLFGRNITETYSFVKKCNLFVGNDSGMMHLSAAAKIFTIGLFGPTNDQLYAPFGKKCYTIRTKESYEYFNTKKINQLLCYMNSIEEEDVFNFILSKKILQ